ncbi:MAG: ATP/GTP-binding protein [Bdellovibrionota bacterium]
MKQIPKIVLTGGPCAGKTTMAEILARSFQGAVVNVPESASLLFSGGFPRYASTESQRATQRAVFHVQHELEATYASQFPGLALVLDRGTVDGAAYWPEGPEAFFAALGTSLKGELARYTSVIYLESAPEKAYWAHQKQNPNRTESWEEAKRLDEHTFQLWSQHSRFFHIRNNRSFHYKVSEVLSAVSSALGVDEVNEKK